MDYRDEKRLGRAIDAARILSEHESRYNSVYKLFEREKMRLDPAQEYIRKLREPPLLQSSTSILASHIDAFAQLAERQKESFLTSQIDALAQSARAWKELAEINAIKRKVMFDPITHYQRSLFNLESSYFGAAHFESHLFSGLRNSVDRINRSINEASYLGEFIFDEDEEDLDSESRNEYIEETLIKVVPEEALDDLRKVEFLPIKILDDALRNPEIMRTFEPRYFERFSATLIDKLGFENVTLTPRSGDGGRDIIAIHTINGIQILFAFECKQYKRKVGPSSVRALLGTLVHRNYRANKGVLVTSSLISPGAREFILTEPSLDGRDFNDIIAWLREASNS